MTAEICSASLQVTHSVTTPCLWVTLNLAVWGKAKGPSWKTWHDHYYPHPQNNQCQPMPGFTSPSLIPSPFTGQAECPWLSHCWISHSAEMAEFIKGILMITSRGPFTGTSILFFLLFGLPGGEGELLMPEQPSFMQVNGNVEAGNRKWAV